MSLLSIQDFLSKIDGVITSKNASILLNESPARTALILSRWSQQGWLNRIGRGVYVPRMAFSNSLDNSLSLAFHFVDEGYVCGWSACEYWGITDQIFLNLSLASYQISRVKKINLKDRKVILFPAGQDIHIGLKTLWQQDKKFFVSDLDKTIFDMVNYPKWSLGIMNLIDCLKEYLKFENHDLEKVMYYAEQLNASGSFYKRFGFLLESLGDDHKIIGACYAKISKGYLPLDPLMEKGKIIKKWNLIIPNNLKI